MRMPPTAATRALASRRPAGHTAAATPAPWYRSGIFWGAVSAVGTVASAVVAYLALGR